MSILESLELAEDGDAVAQNILGAILATGECAETGERIEIDCAGAFYWYCQAIKSGYVHAKWNAGTMLIHGDDGVEKNQVIGFRLIGEAADVNENSACLFLSRCYQRGSYGKETNEELSRYWSHRAWDYKNAKEFDRPIDLEAEYSMKLTKPKVVLI